jgi:hypothetical protein
MKLLQGQVWKTADQYLRITELERLSVKYKAMKDLEARTGTHHQVTKKDFCRLIKSATLYTKPADSEITPVPETATETPTIDTSTSET